MNSKIMTSISNKTQGFLTLTSTRLEDQEFKLLAAATGLDIVPEEVVIAFNSVLVVATMAEHAVSQGRNPYNYEELMFNSSQIEYLNTIGNHNYSSGDRIEYVSVNNPCPARSIWS